MLWFVGLGIRGAAGLSLDARDILTRCDIIYLESFTSPIQVGDIKKIEELVGKPVTPVRRWFVEDGREIISGAQSRQVALVTYGDPLIATTHAELRTRATKQNVATQVLHSSSGLTALIGETGLHFYKFSRSVTIMSDLISAISVYNVVYSNLLSGSHTLILTEYRQDDNSGEHFLDPRLAINALIGVERDNGYGAFTEDTFIIVASRIAQGNQSIISGAVKELASTDFGNGPHSIIVTGSLHFTESESLQALTRCICQPSDNSDRVNSIGRQMLKKYIPKAKSAIKSLRGLDPASSLSASDLSVLENAEYYLQDAEKFGRDGRLELAVLSVGYAEGLIDALRFQKGLNPWES